MQKVFATARVEVDHAWRDIGRTPYRRVGPSTWETVGKASVSFFVVVLLHALVVAVLMTRTVEYKPLDLLAPAPSLSMQVTMIDAPEPEPVPAHAPAAPILTSDQGVRDAATAAPREVAPEPQPVPPPAAEVPVVNKTPPPKPRPVRPKPPAETSQPARSERLPTTPQPARKDTPVGKDAPVAAAVNSSGNLAPGGSAAQPKSVASVGCMVPEPEYPRRAERLQQEGDVLVRLVISAEGQLLRHDIARSSGYEALDQAALAAVAQARCTPYRENGQAITVMTLQPVNFRLDR
ncbi:energy transducer TonB [Dickeya dadantii]|uniref:energy transducer TonB n=1 Tax=Dickeya dadantii TaxID=204038 RepID=UPI001CF4E545|nr:energy transducer TonB [Dickeya dadantii]MCA7013646.1 energy transducer TonB [Dickeya dadantii]